MRNLRFKYRMEVMMIKTDYIRSGKFITFLWKPKIFYAQLRNSPIILFPILIALCFIVLGKLLVFVSIYPSFSSISLDVFSFGLTINFVLVTFLLLFTSFYFYVVLIFAKNKQSFKLILSLVLHAYLAYLYGSLFLYLFKIFFMNMVGDSGGLISIINPTWLLYFIYLGMGLKWGLSISSGQFLFAFISYFVLIVIVIVLLILLVVWLFIMLISGISESIPQLFQLFFGH
ncbi:hypothetical protein ABU914_11410 [Bacillaceae bacterium YX66]